jgi:hypothetical protein
MTTLKAVGVWIAAVILSIIVGWEFIKAIFEIRETVSRYHEFKRMRTEPTDPIPFRKH